MDTWNTGEFIDDIENFNITFVRDEHNKISGEINKVYISASGNNTVFINTTDDVLDGDTIRNYLAQLGLLQALGIKYDRGGDS